MVYILYHCVWLGYVVSQNATIKLLQASWAITILQGMCVLIKGKKIRRSRNFILLFLLSEGPEVKTVQIILLDILIKK